MNIRFLSFISVVDQKSGNFGEGDAPEDGK